MILYVHGCTRHANCPTYMYTPIHRYGCGPKAKNLNLAGVVLKERPNILISNKTSMMYTNAYSII